MFEVAHAGEVLVQSVAITRAHITLQILHLIGNGIEDAASGVEFLHLRLDLRRSALQEKLFEDRGRFIFRRNGHACARPRKTAAARVDTKSERRKPCENADLFRDVLVEGNGVAKRTAAGMWCRRQETYISGMPSINVRVRYTAKNAEVIAMCF